MTILTGDFTDAAAVPQWLPTPVPPATLAAGMADPMADRAVEAGPVTEADEALSEDALPDDALLYKRHIEDRLSIRALARETGCHASTILRRIRRFETRRDDPLVDRGIERAPDALSADERIELRRALRRLAEPGAQLVLAAAMDTAIVTRSDVRTAVLSRRLAELMALRGWVALVAQGRITRHALTSAGRAALRSMMSGQAGTLPLTGAAFADATPVTDPATPASSAQGLAEAAARYQPPGDCGPAAAQAHRIYEDRVIDDPEDGLPRRMRANLAESPLLVLARRRDANGQPFLDARLVAAAERLREDFELAQMGPRVTQNWQGFLTAGIDAGYGSGLGGGSEAARRRVAAALRELGPGMDDLALRVCCFLEGIELTERRLGWAARSGKVVLRLALMRLARHYAERYGDGSPLIG